MFNVLKLSATKHIGLDKLEDAILLQAGIMDLIADPDMPAAAYVVEAKMERGLGQRQQYCTPRNIKYWGCFCCRRNRWTRAWTD